MSGADKPMAIEMPPLSQIEHDWSGVTVRTEAYQYDGRKHLHTISGTDVARLNMLLEEVGGICEPRVNRTKACEMRRSHLTRAKPPGF